MLRNTSIKVFAMKKYLIVGALALVAGLFVTSCNHDDELYGSGDLATQKTEAFQKAFVSAFGQINANQNWGFYDEDLASITAAATRAASARTRTADVNANEWVQKGYNVPSAITAREYEVVMDYFRKTPNPQSETVNIHNYFIQNVGYTDHTYYAYYEKDGRTVTVTITNPGTSHMNWIFCGPGLDENGNRYNYQDGDEHINNFNAGSGEIQHILYTGSEYFGFNDSYGTDHQAGKSEHKYGTINRNFTIRFIDVDGVVGCYVGFNYETGKINEEGWHLDPDAYFDDRVIKLTAAEGSIFTPIKKKDKKTFSTWGTPSRVICEDLGNVSYNDIDYNDVVFDAQIEHRIIKEYEYWYIHENDKDPYKTVETTKEDKHYAHIKLLAAGGTMPLTVAGVEVHDAFDVGVATMVNTVTNNNQKVVGSYVTRDYVDLGEFPGIEKINDIPVIVNYTSSTGGAAVELETTPGKAPHKILVLADYKDDNGNIVKGTDWPCERANLGDAYPGFKDYVASPKVDDVTGEFVYDENGNVKIVGGKEYAGQEFWNEGSNSEYLFHSWVGINCGEARYTTTTKEEKTDDGRTIYVIYYEGGTGYDISSPLYFTNKTQLTDLNMAANDVIRIYGSAADPTNWHIGISNGNSKSVAAVGSSQGNWTGYVDIILTADMVTKLTEASDMAAMIISGTGIVVTEVDFIKAK